MKNYISVIVNGGNYFRSDALKELNTRESMIYELIDYIRENKLSKELKTLIFPAGYLCVKDKKAVDKLSKRIGRNISSKGCKFKVVWGIDVVENNSKKKIAGKNGRLPFYAFALQPGKSLPLKFKQVSATSEDGKDLKIEKQWGKRPVCIPGSKEALLICGESWSSILMEKVKNASPKVLIVVAHQKVNLQKNPQGWGKMSWHLNLKKFRDKTGTPVILSEHTRSPHRHKYSWPGHNTRNIELPPEMSKMFTAKLTQI